jgi:hypothetical protein
MIWTRTHAHTTHRKKQYGPILPPSLVGDHNNWSQLPEGGRHRNLFSGEAQGSPEFNLERRKSFKDLARTSTHTCVSRAQFRNITQFQSHFESHCFKKIRNEFVFLNCLPFTAGRLTCHLKAFHNYPEERLSKNLIVHLAFLITLSLQWPSSFKRKFNQV